MDERTDSRQLDRRATRLPDKCDPASTRAVLLMDRAPFKITQGHARILKTVFDGNADCRRRNMKQNSWDKGRGEGCNNSARWHRLLCNWAPKLFIHQPPCLSPPPLFPPPQALLWLIRSARLEAARWDAYARGGWNDLGFCSKFCALIMDSNFRVYTARPVIIWTKKKLFSLHTPLSLIWCEGSTNLQS